MSDGSAPHCHGHEGSNAPGRKFQDPVCGMTVGPESPLQHTHAATLYRFCSPDCLAKFRDDPGRYLDAGKEEGKAAGITAAASAGVEHTCPMHPEVRQAGPGSCPKCGMALEARTVS